MNTSTIQSAATTASGSAVGAATRYVVTVGETRCEVRGREIAMISEVLGFEQEMEMSLLDLEGIEPDHDTIADLLDSRMIAPPRTHRRRQRPVSSRAMFYAAASK